MDRPQFQRAVWLLRSWPVLSCQALRPAPPAVRSHPAAPAPAPPAPCASAAAGLPRTAAMCAPARPRQAAFPGSAPPPPRRPARAHWRSGGRPWPPQRGSGSTGRPITAISATDEAPTRADHQLRLGQAARNVGEEAAAPRPGRPPRHRPRPRASASSSRA